MSAMADDTARPGGDFESVAGLILRPETEADLEFLYHLYASTRADEMAALDWTPEQKEAFLRMQFSAQRGHYREHYRDCRFDVIEREGEAIGRLYVLRRPDDIIVVDIALMPEHRGQGLGGGLMRALLDEAAGVRRSIMAPVRALVPEVWGARRVRPPWR